MAGYLVKIQLLLKVFQAGRDLRQGVRSFLSCWKDRENKAQETFQKILTRRKHKEHPRETVAACIPEVDDAHIEHTCRTFAFPLPRLAPSCSYLWEVMAPPLPPFRSQTGAPPSSRQSPSVNCISRKNCFRTQTTTPAPEMRPWANQLTSLSL